MGAVLRVEITSNYDDKGTRTAAQKLDDLAGKAKLAAAGIAAGAGVVVKAASDQEQAFGGLRAVFGDQAKSMETWSKQQAGIGLSAKDAAQQVTYMGSMLKGAGMEMDQAGEQAKSLTQLGADLGATYGYSASEGVEALGAALRGEYDSIEKFGVSIKQSDVNARLAAKGQDELTGEALKAAEMAARLELIWEKTSEAQGQAGREAETTAGRMGALQATGANLAATYGEALLPYAEQFLGILQGLLPVLENNQGLIMGIVGAVGAFAAAIIGVNAAVKTYQAVTTTITAVTKAWRTAQLFLNVALMANPIGLLVTAVALLVAAIVGLVAWFVHLYKTNEEFRDKVDAIWAAIKRAWDALVSFIVDAWEAYVEALKRDIATIKRWWSDLVARVKELWNRAVTNVKEAWNGLVEKVRSVVGRILEVVSKIVTRVKEIAQAVKGPFVSAFQRAKSVIGGAIDWLIRKVESLLAKLRDAKDRLVPSFSWPWSASAASFSVRPLGLADDGPSTRSTSPVVVNVYGAVDPVGTAETIRDVLSRDVWRRGGVEPRPAWVVNRT